MVDTPPAPGRTRGTVVVTLPGEIDMTNADSVGAELTAAFGPGADVVIADLSGTRFCDTSGIHALVMAYKKAQASNTGFRVVAGPGEVRRVLEILRLDTVLDLYPRLEPALLAGGQARSRHRAAWRRGIAGPARAFSQARRLLLRAVTSQHG